MINKRVALYLRLSKEDLEKNNNELISESIKNQELMLKEEVNKHKDWKIVGIYSDEDFSGAGTYRPEFEKMIESCEKREIDIVLCKSQSRFSRDMEIIEKYIHNKFKEWNIRFISIVDNADTLNLGNKKSRQINALINEWFLEDLSDNIRATLKTKWTNGESTASFATYGLIKDPKNKNHLLIDPYASNIIKYIGSLIIKGYGQDKIASILNEKNIPSPYEYKLLNGCNLKLPILNLENKKTITKSGTYVIKFYLYNNYKEILKNIKTNHYIKSKNNNYKIKLRSISDNIEVYSSDTLLNINDYIDNNIISYIKELDRLIDTYFEIELTLIDNLNHDTLYIENLSNLDNNIDIKFDYEIRKKYKWSGKSIYNIMKNEIYNGTLIQGKTKRVSYKNHHSIKNDKENWVISKNALEKIFDDGTFNKIQMILNNKSRSQTNGIKHIFFGKIYCNICNNIMHKNTSYNTTKKKRIEYLICKDKQNKWTNCDNKKSINLNILDSIILDELNKYLDKYFDLELLLNLYNKNNFDINKNIKNKLIKDKNNIENQIEEKNRYLKKIYEDKINNIIDEEDFNILRLNYKEEIERLNTKLSMINKEIDNTKDNNLDKDILLKYKKFNKLTRSLVDVFINKIKIDKLENLSRNIIIEWNF